MDWKKEIQTGPLAEVLAPFVTKGDDVTVVALLNEKTIDSFGTISGIQLLKWAAKTGMLSKVHDVSQDTGSSMRGSALALLSLINVGNDIALDPKQAGDMELLDGWIEKDALLALSTIKISRAEEAMGRDVTLDDVARTRGK